jgi:hypothetical protein
MKAILDTSVLIATDVQPLDGELAISALRSPSCTSVCSSLRTRLFVPSV